MTANDQYRPDIDGLRGLAIAAVLAHHFAGDWIAGGHFGVDLFFVISGYLIARNIARDMEAERFSFSGFYLRRARRLLPALLLVLAVSVPLAIATMTPAALAAFGDSMVASLLFFANMHFWSIADYFAPLTTEIPLIHLWSLGVEEQFYLIFPICMTLAFWIGRRWLLPGLLLGLVLGFGCYLYIAAQQSTTAFYWLPARAWQLLAGACVALLPVNRSTKSKGQQGQEERFGWVPASLGLGLLMIAIVVPLPSPTDMPEVRLLPVVGAALLIATGPASGVVTGFLQSKALRGLGLISYSTYLWHQPLAAFTEIWNGGALTVTQSFALPALACGLGWATWRWVEQPFRDPEAVSNRRFLMGLVWGYGMLLSCAWVMSASDGLPSRMPEAAQKILIDTVPAERHPSDCLPQPALVGDLMACSFKPQASQRLMLIGDSHAAVLATALGRELANNGVGLDVRALSSCPLILGVAPVGRKDCWSRNEAVLAELARPSSPSIVILSARWALYLEGERFSNGEGGVEKAEPVSFRAFGGAPTGRLDRAAMIAATQAAIQRLLDLNKTVIIVGNVPEVGWHVPKAMVARILRSGDRFRQLTTSHARFLQRDASTQSAFDAFAGQALVIRFEAANLLCAQPPGGRCQTAAEDGRLLYADTDHLSRVGSALVARSLGPVALKSVENRSGQE